MVRPLDQHFVGIFLEAGVSILLQDFALFDDTCLGNMNEPTGK